MGLFGKKKEEAPSDETVSENSEEYVLKEELEKEVEKLQNEFRTKQDEVNDIVEKIGLVKEEYEATVSSVMLVKKELNQKKMELDVVKREYREIKERIEKSEQIKDEDTLSGFNKTEENFSKIKQELEEMTKEREEIKEQFEKEQSSLHIIRKQQIEAQKELDEANSRLYNAKEELNKKDQFQDTDILTPKEKEFIEGSTEDKSSAGIIEAASAVVGSLKSKLNMTQKELEAVQLLLEKEREEHEKLKIEIEKLRKPSKES